MKGTVKSFKGTQGFIEPENKQLYPETTNVVYVHFLDVFDGTLKEGQKVSFDVVLDTTANRLKAINVQVITDPENWDGVATLAPNLVVGMSKFWNEKLTSIRPTKLSSQMDAFANEISGRVALMMVDDDETVLLFNDQPDLLQAIVRKACQGKKILGLFGYSSNGLSFRHLERNQEAEILAELIGNTVIKALQNYESGTETLPAESLRSL